MRVDRRVHHTGDVDFPLSHYHGITIGFFMEQAEKAIDEEMPTISVDIASLAPVSYTHLDVYKRQNL